MFLYLRGKYGLAAIKTQIRETVPFWSDSLEPFYTVLHIFLSYGILYLDHTVVPEKFQIFVVPAGRSDRLEHIGVDREVKEIEHTMVEYDYGIAVQYTADASSVSVFFHSKLFYVVVFNVWD